MSMSRRLFTKREQMILLALGLLALIAYPAVKAWHATVVPPIPPQPSACQTNLFLIDQAITRWATSHGYSTTNEPTVQDIASYFKKGNFPTCPNHGKYQLGTLALASTCDIHGRTVNVAIYPKKNPVSEFVRNFIFMRPSSRFINRNACIANMKQLDGAAQQWALENKRKDNELVKPSRRQPISCAANFSSVRWEENITTRKYQTHPAAPSSATAFLSPSATASTPPPDHPPASPSPRSSSPCSSAI